ncbi:MAG TPA: SUMF1/EgtB/PvdO family nonheme iron enzyme [Pyrinomonadaceae bacterium]|nr:SUMF1/EgtB/PvdO family nonheme iron enzyme [Pyrinomonadaceae bacterium]
MGKLGTSLVFLCLFATVHPVYSQTGPSAAADQKIAYTENGRETELYKGKSYALVIGNSRYLKWNALPGVDDDVEAISQTLTGHGFKVEVAKNLTSDALDARVSKFIRDWGYEKDRRIVIYFAGHGDTQRAADGRKQGYIIPIDAPRFSQNEADFRRLAISMNRVEEWAKRIEAYHALFIFDSCFAGNLVTRSDISYPFAIRDYLTKPVRQFITSGDENQTVNDNSYFRRVVVEGLEGSADLSADGYITGSELAQYVRENVTNQSNGRQTPLYGMIRDGMLDRGDVIFRVPLQARQATEKRAQDAWAKVPKNDADAVQRFVNTYPGSALAVLARERIPSISSSTRSPTRSDTHRGAVEPGPRLLESTNIDFQTATYDAKGVISKSKKATAGLREELAGGQKIEMVKIPSGKFRMGGVGDNEKPIREVTVDEFYMSSTEITQAQWRVIAKTKRINIDLELDPSMHTGEEFPVESITWEQAKEFCSRLSRETGRTYDLPSEAEWEYAARGGSMGERPFGAMLGSDVANYDALPRANAFTKYSTAGMRRGETIAPGSLQIANGFGLYDILGNVAEWCLDSYQADYKAAPTTAVARETNSIKRVVRGGSYDTLPSELTVTHRKGQNQNEQFPTTGFRVVLRSRAAR